MTRRANQGHINIIADIVAPAPGNRQRAFHWRRRNPQRQFQIVEPVSLDFRSFVYRPISSDCGNYRFRTSRRCFDISRKCSDNPKKDLTRRANQGHINIIARTDKARAEKSAAGFLFGVFGPGRCRRPAVSLNCCLASRVNPTGSAASAAVTGSAHRAGASTSLANVPINRKKVDASGKSGIHLHHRKN